MQGKRIVSAFMSLALAVGLMPAPAFGNGLTAERIAVSAQEALEPLSGVSVASGLVSQHKPTADEIKEAWKALPSEPSGKAIFQVENDNAAYTAAELTTDAKTYAKAYLNFIRYSANLGSVELDDALNANAAQGALIMAAGKQFKHDPDTPAGVTDEQALAGKYACANSNISYAAGTLVPNALQTAIQGQVDDSDASNLYRLGHRRWLLNPALSTTGIGSAYGLEDGWHTMYTDIRVMTKPDGFAESYGTVGTSGKTDYQYIAWPASGDFASNVFDMGTPWSLTLNEALYRDPDAADVSVTVTRKADGKSWTMTAADSTVAEGGKFLFVENGGYGVSNCIIFNPGTANLAADAYAGAYSVEVTGLKTKLGTAATLSYEVDFFDASEGDAVKPEPGTPVTPETPVTPPDSTGGSATDEKTVPKITVKKTSKTVKASAAKKKAQSFKIGAKANSGGKISYKVTKKNAKMSFKKGKVTLKKGAYKKGSTLAMKVRVKCAAQGDFASGKKAVTLKFKVK